MIAQKGSGASRALAEPNGCSSKGGPVPRALEGAGPTLPSLFLVGLLLVSAFAFLPTALPGAAAAPYPGPEPTPTNLTVFLHNSTLPQPITGGIFSSELLTTTNDTASPWSSGGFLDIAGRCVTCVQVPFYLFPRAAGPLTLNGTPTANVFINWTGTSVACTLGLTLSAVSPTGATTTLGTPATSSCTGTKGSLGLPVRVVYGSPLLATLPAGWSLEAFLTLTGSASNSGYGIWWGKVGGAYFPSDLDLPASTYLAVNQTYVVGPGGTVTGNLNTSVRTPVAALRANLSDPLGNYDYTNWTVNWTVTSLTGGIYGAGAMVPFGPSIPPAFYGYNETYTAAYNYSWVPAGSYTLCVNATDNTAHNDLLFSGAYGRAANGCANFNVGGAPNLLTLHVRDSLGATLVRAGVRVAGAYNLTDVTGTTHYRLANGTYSGSVTWEGVLVASPSIVVKGPTVLTINASVYSPVLSFEDQSGQALSNALVYLVHPNGSSYPLRVTGPSGNLSLTQVPQGNFGLTVVWHDSVVYAQPGQPPVAVGANVAYAVLVHVYWQNFEVVEPTGTTIALASVVVENFTNGVVVSFGITDATGTTPARVPYGNFSVLVYWQTSRVAEVNVSLLPSLADPYVIQVAIFQVSFLAVDSQGAPVGGATIEIVGPGGPVTSLVTGPSGAATAVLPGSSYTLVTRWEGVTVGVSTAVISSASSFTLNLAIYDLTIGTEDAKTFPVAGATVSWVSSSGYANGSLLTNSTGWGSTRLPGTTFDLSMSWEGVGVGTSTINVSQSGSTVLSLEVYYLTMDAVDSKALPVGDASVALSLANGPLSQLFLTGTNGTAVARLPTGSYDVVVNFEGVSVYAGPSVPVSSDGEVSLALEVYYLTVDTVDNGGAELAGVFLQVVSVTTGVAMGSATTTSQATVLRLPIGTYWVVGTLRATYDLSSVDQTVNQTVNLASDQPVTLKFTKAPPAFFSTNEFDVIMGFLGLGLLLVLVVSLLSRRRRGPTSRTSASGAGSGGVTGPATSAEGPKEGEANPSGSHTNDAGPGREGDSSPSEDRE